jgi:hypothetical protein
MREVRKYVPKYQRERPKDISARPDKDRPAPTGEALEHLILEISQARPNPRPGKRRR